MLSASLNPLSSYVQFLKAKSLLLFFHLQLTNIFPSVCILCEGISSWPQGVLTEERLSPGESSLPTINTFLYRGEQVLHNNIQQGTNC